jgi:MFS transporter, ACDE family, multidrug resistance protein
MSLNGMVLRIGQTLGPLTAGLFFALGGIKGAFFGGASVALLMIGIVFLSFKPKKEAESGPLK